MLTGLLRVRFVSVCVFAAACVFCSAAARAQSSTDSTGPSPVDVTLKEFVIQMPATLPAGPTVLDVSNKGTLDHNLEITGNGVDRKFPQNLRPGQTSTMRLDLTPGTYRVFCPVGSHAARGMDMQLTVTAAPQTAGQPGASSPVAAAGADQHQPPASSESGDKDEQGSQQGGSEPKHTWPPFIRWLGKFHPAMVNFPIGLLIAAGVAELLLMITGRPFFRDAARYCIWFGVLTAMAAAVLGWFFGGVHLADHRWNMTVHRWLGTTTGAWSIVVLVLSERSRRKPSPGAIAAYRIALLIGVLLVSVTGFFGGTLAYGLNHYAWPH